MKYILILPFLTFFIYSNGQNNWLRSAGGANNDESVDMASTSDGAFVITGYFGTIGSFGATNITSSGLSDAFVQKIDDVGNTIWAKKIGGTKSDRASSVAIDDDGNIYVTGFYTQSAAFGTLTLDSGSDSLEIFITKLNVSGDFLWAKSCGGVSDDRSYGIAVDGDANVIVTGQFRGVAQFGNFNLTSDMYNDNSYWSYDVFTTKLDTDGNFLWAKKGSAPDDDRGLSVCTDNFNNIYVSGQFTDTITFDAVHLNEVDNAGFLIKYNTDGSEIWMDKFAASQVLCYDVASDLNHDIMVTGEFIGNLAIFNDGIDFVNTNYPFNIFLTKFSQSGSLLWASHAGSENPVSAKAVCVGSGNEAYVAGTFNCRMDEFSLAYGEGIFNSAGFRDVFVTRFNQNGERIWERQFASAKDDYCSAIAFSGTVDRPIISGSYASYFNVPSASEFISGTDNVLTNPNLYTPNCSAYCNDYNYSSFISIKSDGNKDIFITSPVALTRSPYDYYYRPDGNSTLCDRPIVEPCLDIYSYYSCYSGNCPDSVLLCNPGHLYSNEHTGSHGFIGPSYIYLWENGSIDTTQLITNSGWKSVTITRADGCDSFTDSVHVTVAPPVCPLTSDDAGTNNTGTCNPQLITVCAPQVVHLVASGFDSNDYSWSNDSIGTNNAETDITQTGTYAFYFNDEFGCTRTSSVQVQVNQTLDTIAPYIIGQFITNIPDSGFVEICYGDSFVVKLLDGILSNPETFYSNVEVSWQIILNNQMVESCLNCNVDYYFYPEISGWYHVIATPTLQNPFPCSSTVQYPAVDYWVNIQVNPLPTINLTLEGDYFICPGTAATFIAGGAQSFLWTGPGTNVSGNNFVTSTLGTYTLHGYSSEGSCSSGAFLTFLVQAKPDPEVWMEPAGGVVCPGDSVQLICEEGIEYHWIGPLGNEIDTTQSIYVTIPGFYYCILTDSLGCILESNTVEVKEYSTPYLFATPGNDLCVNGSVLIQLASNDYESIEWDAPLSGSTEIQLVLIEGIYNVSVTFCEITTQLTITITDSDTPAEITVSDMLFCPGDTLLLTANPGMQSYLWQPGNNPNDEIAVTAEGIYSLTTLDELGCMGYTNINLIHYPINPPTTSSQTICSGDEATLVADSENDIFWTSDIAGNDILVNGPIYQTTVFNNSIFYAFSQDELCNSYPAVTEVLMYESSLSPTILGNDEVCIGDNVMLTTDAVTGLIYNWLTFDGEEQENDSLSVYGSMENIGWYYLLAFDENCSSIDSIYVNVLAPQLFQLDPDNAIQVCVGNSITLNSPVEAQQYYWTTPNGVLNGGPQLNIGAAQDFDSGIYNLNVNGSVCEFEFTPVLVDVNSYPDLITDPPTLGCIGGYMTVYFDTLYDNYNWSTGENYVVMIPPDTGWYYVEVSNAPNCSANDSIYVPSITCINEFVNIITPNGDHLNDIVDFGILRREIEQVEIRNRWGTIIKKLTRPLLIWDGSIDGEGQATDGVYFYTITYATHIYMENKESTLEEGILQVLDSK